MAVNSAGADAIKKIRELALLPNRVLVLSQAKSDMQSWLLKKDDVCDAIVEWIDAGERVKPTILHSVHGHQGETAYEMKPRIKTPRRGSVLFYIKVTIIESPDSQEEMLLISVHPDH